MARLSKVHVMRTLMTLLLLCSLSLTYKLYHDGAFYDYRQDPLEKSALALTSLTPAQKQSRQKLQQALDTLK